MQINRDAVPTEAPVGTASHSLVGCFKQNYFITTFLTVV